MQDIPLREGDRAWPLVAEAGRRLGEFADRPAFIGWGLRDFVFDRHFLAGFRDALPRARVMAFDDAGHYVLEDRSEEHTSELQSLMRISYAVFCLKKKTHSDRSGVEHKTKRHNRIK